MTPATLSHGAPRAAGFTLLELILVLAIGSIVSAVAVPRVGAMLDTVAVHGAANDAQAMLQAARHAAMTRGERATVDIDTTRTRLLLRVGNDTLSRRDEASLNAVRFHASRGTVTYTQLGLGFGVSNLTLIISKGSAADTITVSRLGRVRR
jgi:prepilin-type N-terminal cleavage/methylation domain-containing protein